MTSNIAPSIVTVYIRNGTQTLQSTARTREALSLLRGKGLRPKQLAVVDVEPYPKLAQWLEAQSIDDNGTAPDDESGEPYPLIFVGDKLIGPWEKLQLANTTGQLDEQLKEHLYYVKGLERSKDDTKQQKTSWFGFVWGHPGKKEEENHEQTEVGQDVDKRMDFEEIPRPTDKDENDVTEEAEIEVWRTNWLWRQQRRVLRFSADSFMRVDPATRAVRAVFKYDNVDSVVIDADTSIVIRFTDDTETQYIQTRDAADRERLILMLMNRATMHSGHFVHVTDERKAHVKTASS